MQKFATTMHPHQRATFEAFDSGKKRKFLLEWARRHRKTTLAVNLLTREACTIPNAKYVYIAPTNVMARNIVWDDPNMLKAYLPDKKLMGWKLNESLMQVKFDNGSIIKVGGSDKPDSLRGIDAIGAVFDEWALIKEETWTEILRPIMAGPLPPEVKKLKLRISDGSFKKIFRWAMFLYTCKGVNHAPIMFDKAIMRDKGYPLPVCGEAEKMEPGWYASRLDGELAGIMSSTELAEAKKDMPKVLYDQEIKNSRITSEEMTLITSEMIHNLTKINWEMTRNAMPDMRKIVSVDPAFGGDICKIKGFENTKVAIDESVLNRHKTEEVVFEVKKVCSQLGTKNIIGDTIGIGKGVMDGLAADEAGYNVQYFNSSETPVVGEAKNALNLQFLNKRAEAYFYVAEQIRKLRCEPIKSNELLRQLPIASRYRVGTGKLQIIAKDRIREELKCSPDEADCFVMGIYGLQFVEPENETDRVSSAVGVPSFIQRW